MLSLLSMTLINFESLLLFSAFLRLFLIIYGEWQDTHMEVRYTDVDYLVFSDAAALVASGISPYKRLTSTGGFVYPKNFEAARGSGGIYSVVVWLFNPFTFTIGTRGNCEPIVCAMILWIIICLMNGKMFQAAFWYGLVVHLRIYPIIYALPIILNLDPWHFRSGKKPYLMEWSSANIKSVQSSTSKKVSVTHELWTFVMSLFTRGRLMFGLISGSVFFFFTGIFFYIYEWEFLHEALLYHLTRTDPRHSFSIYFYHIYLHYKQEFSVSEKLISFPPQVIVQLVLVFHFSKDLSFCFFLQTVAFVAFNKVISAQYFVWFFCLLPLILPWNSMNLKWGLSCTLLWVGAQTHWLMWGYLLEFKGKQVFIQLWAASLLFLAVNTFLLICIIINQTCSPVFKQLKLATVKKPMKHKL